MLSINNETFTFEDFGSPSIPGCTIVFEFGIADSNGFVFIDGDEAKKIVAASDKKVFDIMDFFCAIRYYKDYTANKKPQKFDYYLARFEFTEDAIVLKVLHERGPRYLSPADIVDFLAREINETPAGRSRKILKKIKQPTD